MKSLQNESENEGGNEVYLWPLKSLNPAKFSLVQTLEESLPKQPYIKDWKELEEKKRYLKGTTMERILPISFLVL